MDTASAGTVLAETAWAKLNLYLHVTRIRDDGYHELDSLFVFTDIGDRLSVEPADTLSLALDGPFAGDIPASDDNLVLRAARALSDIAGPARQGALIRLTKNLPVASGIGGGSADAAAALRLLNRVWGLGLLPPALERIGEGLGADIPACVRSIPTQVSGIGEILTDAAPLPPCWVVLVNPGVAVATPAVFRRFDADVTAFRAPAPLPAADRASALAGALRERHNDLQPPAIALAPVILDVLAALETQDGCLMARMSGSGATCFGLFPDSSSAARAAGILGARNALWWTAHGVLRSGGG
ncbi:4-(cytidine 5'-diphospho)-2-C-methyl-D-erythritol kinase [Iodidimonas sp. SYSU 1G8]|uniref:4-(cytidine 5'-diphospho)-2-C-methyl-D-erythritol kinase n=1 Tax=Iodidimonas sp. SYSU 1G8 TaxID=3133967 RepID=UPI0031FE9FC7